MTHHCRAIDLAVRFRHYEEVGECWDERCAVAEKSVSPLEQTELLCIIFPEECQEDIARHSECPQRVGGHEPAQRSSQPIIWPHLRFRKTYH